MAPTLSPLRPATLPAPATGPVVAEAPVSAHAGAATAAGAFAVVFGLAVANGGYFPTSWGWSALALLWASAMALVVRAPARPTALEIAFLAAIGGLVVWIALSATWSSSLTRTVLELEHALVYLAGALAVLLLTQRRTVPHLLGGALAGITLVCAYGLATRLFPARLGTFDPVAGYRLSEPLGYWNALAIIAAIGALLALGLAARSGAPAARALAASGLVVLLPTLYFTFSRGGWIALAVGVAAALALDGRRLQLITALLVLAPVPGLAVWLSSRSGALTRQSSPLEEASHDGHWLALAILVLALVAAGLAVALSQAERRLRPGRAFRRAYAGALILALSLALAAVFVHYGSPPALVVRAYDAFNAPPPQVTTDLNDRLFSFSGNGRPELWGTAWDLAQAQPLLGSGAGTFERYWLQHRPTDLKVRDAHSLYLETLAELGPVGMAVLLAALALPVAAAIRARRHPLVPAALGAYVAYLVHAGVDWDWEMTAVTLAALLCGAACLLSARLDSCRPLGRKPRLGLLAAAFAIVPFAAVGLLGSGALAASTDAAAAGDWPRAESQARRAASLAPWSSDPWRLLGEAQLAQGDLAGALASLEKAITEDPGDWTLWLDLARASEGPRRWQALVRAARLNPLSPEIAHFRSELDFEAPLLAAPTEEETTR